MTSKVSQMGPNLKNDATSLLRVTYKMSILQVPFVTVQGNGMEHQRAAVERQSHSQVQHTQQAPPQQQM